MATSNFILEALEAVGREVVDAGALTQTFVQLNGDTVDSPSWPWVVSRMVERITFATDELETLIRQRALPVLQDMEKVMAVK